MFEFSIEDTTLLKVSGVCGAAYGLHALGAPRHFADTWMSAAHNPPDDTVFRWMGLTLTQLSAANLVVSRSKDQDNVKDYLKFAGAGWLTCAAYTAYNASEGIQKRDISLASAAGMATMGSLCLWRGFSDD